MSDKEDDLFIEGTKKIKQLIQDKQIKPADIAHILELSKGTMSKWFQNSTPSTAQSLIELARLVGVSERWKSEARNEEKIDLVTKAYEQSELDLKTASVDQLMMEIKARYAALNLKAEIKISVEPLEGGFVTRD
ncbi:helix-turn-helix domain-containing protein [Acinetobacter silvestris]|uniref:Transcriptional regulator n=1 Tax=Acinetobacter silvestris TaxID=1977882 RepID=A0A1Y3CKG4_9GAMM|nr:helix-turn-helix transcriptional regulator [Acinetobacter silvestris]OTG67600.1 transcriptional regulator [Acinetobacter silvestris]